MRRFLPLLFVLVLLVPAQSATAASRRDVLVFIGGFQSTRVSTLTNFSTVLGWLIFSHGFDGMDFTVFDYGDSTPSATCQPIDQTADQIASTVRRLRDSGKADGAILVAHSLGGVAALDAIARAPDLTAGSQPFIRRVVTVDSPLAGISGSSNALASFWSGSLDCPALNDLQALPATWWTYDVASAALARGVSIATVINPEDDVVQPSAGQGFDGLLVNHTIDVIDSGFNHAAVLKTREGARQLAMVVGEQGQ